MTELFREIAKVAVSREGAEDDEDDLPFAEIGVLDDVDEVFRDDGLEDAEEGEGGGATGKVGCLRRLQQLWAASNSEDQGIGKALGSEA